MSRTIGVEVLGFIHTSHTTGVGVPEFIHTNHTIGVGVLGSYTQATPLALGYWGSYTKATPLALGCWGSYTQVTPLVVLGLAALRKLLSPGRQCAKGADGHCILSPFPATVLEGTRQWAVSVETAVRHHEREGCGHPKVSYEANEERRHDAHGNGLLGVLDFFAWKRQMSVGEGTRARGVASST